MNLMFQPQFEPLILSGRKPHTIRPTRKRPLKVGQPLSLRIWTGKPYRSPQREFMKATVDKVAPIHIDLFDDMTVDGRRMTVLDQNTLAWDDGFENADELRKWFLNTHGLPFTGELIHWKPAQKYATAQRDGFTVPLIGVPASAQPSTGDFRNDAVPFPNAGH